jgi:ribonuclease HII
MIGLFPTKRIPLRLERDLLAAGHTYIVGIDEVGRGCLAGPVVAAAIIIDCDKITIAKRIRDSKLLTPEVREELFDIIIQEAVAYGVGFIEHDVIDKINILQATFEAMKIAISKLPFTPDICLVDGNQKIPISIRQMCIPKGDDLVTSIGAASIIAKVTRDRWMRDVASKEYPQYLFEKNKGYGTEEHIEAIRINGFSAIHRRSFSVNLK